MIPALSKCKRGYDYFDECVYVRALVKNVSSLFCLLLVFYASRNWMNVVTLTPEARTGVTGAAKRQTS